MNALELRGIVRVFERGTKVLDGVGLTVAPGEVVGLLGPNGAGKTTLLKIALGMLHAQEGTVRVFGMSPVSEPIPVKRRVGYVAEDQVLPPYLRVRDVLGLHAELFPTWDEGLARGLLDDFELSPRAKMGKLSKGQARRVAVLCAVAHRPELLLLDEPAAGFDPAARREFLEVAMRHLADDGSAILFSSHHMADVERIASRVAVLHRGVKVIDEDLDDLREGTVLVTLPADDARGAAAARRLDGCLGARVHQGQLRALFRGSEAEALGRVRPLVNGTAPAAAHVNLEELFIELVQGRR